MTVEGSPSRARIAARLAGMLMALLGAVPLYYVRRALGGENAWPRRFLGAIGQIAGAEVTIHGTPLRRRAVLLANHVSWLDVPVLAGASGTAFVAHAGLAENAGLKWLCDMNRTVFVTRGQRGSIAEQVAQVRDALRHDGTLTIFPEGTTSDGSGLLPFKSSLLSALDPPPPGTLVQPVWLDYGPASREVAWFGDELGMDNALRILGRRQPVRIAVHFLEPFDPSLVGDRKAIAAEARARIEAARSVARNPALSP